MKICTCNNCGEVYEDMNPGPNSIDYPEEDLDQLRYIQIQKEEAMWACPKCLTDEALIDNKK